jgi:hypothetical protein
MRREDEKLISGFVPQDPTPPELHWTALVPHQAPMNLSSLPHNTENATSKKISPIPLLLRQYKTNHRKCTEFLPLSAESSQNMLRYTGPKRRGICFSGCWNMMGWGWVSALQTPSVTRPVISDHSGRARVASQPSLKTEIQYDTVWRPRRAMGMDVVGRCSVTK